MSSEAAVMRTRVLRGSAATAVRASLDADLSQRAPSLVNPVAAAAAAADTNRRARDEAARAGYEDGFAAGQRDAAEQVAVQTAQARQALDVARAALEAAVADLATRQQVAVENFEQHVTQLAVQIAEAVVGREIATSSTAGHDAIQRALRLAPEGVDVTARINPADMDTVGDATRLSDRAVSVVADAAVEPGGCVMDVGPCRIDAQVGPALARVRKVLGA